MQTDQGTALIWFQYHPTLLGAICTSIFKYICCLCFLNHWLVAGGVYHFKFQSLDTPLFNAGQIFNSTVIYVRMYCLALTQQLYSVLYTSWKIAQTRHTLKFKGTNAQELTVFFPHQPYLGAIRILQQINSLTEDNKNIIVIVWKGHFV